MKNTIARRIACFSLLTLTVAMAHAATVAPNTAAMPRPAGPATSLQISTQPPVQLSPPDLAMMALSPSKTTVSRDETFKLTYTIKNVGTKPVTHARIHLTADYYQLNGLIDVGSLAPGAEKTSTIDISVPKDSAMGKSPEPYPVHIKFTGAAQVVGANNGAVPDLNPANDEKTTVTVTANPG